MINIEASFFLSILCITVQAGIICLSQYFFLFFSFFLDVKTRYITLLYLNIQCFIYCIFQKLKHYQASFSSNQQKNPYIWKLKIWLLRIMVLNFRKFFEDVCFRYVKHPSFHIHIFKVKESQLIRQIHTLF